jgi:hypothetical protein
VLSGPGICKEMNANTLFRGTDQVADGTIREADGSPLDLTGKTVEFFLKALTENRVVLYKSSGGTDPKITIADPTSSGGYLIRFVPSDTVNTRDGIYRYGIIVRNQTEIVYVGGGFVDVRSTGGEM